jgi:hypothetical protein
VCGERSQATRNLRGHSAAGPRRASSIESLGLLRGLGDVPVTDDRSLADQDATTWMDAPWMKWDTVFMHAYGGSVEGWWLTIADGKVLWSTPVPREDATDA